MLEPVSVAAREMAPTYVRAGFGVVAGRFYNTTRKVQYTVMVGGVAVGPAFLGGQGWKGAGGG